MILVEIRPRGGARQTIALHPGVTVLRGLDAAASRTWATDIARALQGETSASLDVEVEIDGKRESLSSALVESLGLGDAGAAVTVFAVDLPGARSLSRDTQQAPPTDTVHATLDTVAAAEAKVRQLAALLADAERAANAANEELAGASHHLDQTASGALAVGARLESARVAAENARKKLIAVENVIHADAAAAAARSAQAQGTNARLRAERAALGAQRAEVVARMVELGDPAREAAVADALAGLRRLKSVKPRPSARAVELADRWNEVGERLAGLPQPPQPPGWLVIPAAAALQQARETLATASADIKPAAVDEAKVESLARAHRDVLEAEQRVMQKGSRINRRRLDSSHETEQRALGALGLTSYSQYLQQIASTLDDDASGADRLTLARAALADAEAVWNELHGGEASPEWTAAKEHEAIVRTEALALLERKVDDVDLESALRSHREAVVDTEWAERDLLLALASATAPEMANGDGLEMAVESWLADGPSRRDARTALEAELSHLDSRLADVEQSLSANESSDLSDQDSPAIDGSTERPLAPGDGDDVEVGGRRLRARPTRLLQALQGAAEEADQTEREAKAAQSRQVNLLASTESLKSELFTLHGRADERRGEVDRLRIALAEASTALDDVALTVGASNVPGSDPPVSRGDCSADLSAVVGMEAEAYLLARVAALRGAAGGPLPLVLDGHVLSGLTEGAARRVFRLLGRLAGSMQLVVFGDEEQIATWAEGLGDQAAVRSVAR
ncbi:MAG: hypothetical protein M3Q68_07720 [Actinomycetota bacterium]|nr:hypothetical protein [Actinomycetota bacterium]